MLGLEHVIAHGFLALLPGAIHLSGLCCDSAIGKLDLAFTRVCALHGRTLTPRSRSRTLGPSPAHAGTTNHRQGTAHHHEPRTADHEPRTTGHETRFPPLRLRFHVVVRTPGQWPCSAHVPPRLVHIDAIPPWTIFFVGLARDPEVPLIRHPIPISSKSKTPCRNPRDRLARHGRRNEACSSTAKVALLFPSAPPSRAPRRHALSPAAAIGGAAAGHWPGPPSSPFPRYSQFFPLGRLPILQPGPRAYASTHTYTLRFTHAVCRTRMPHAARSKFHASRLTPYASCHTPHGRPTAGPTPVHTRPQLPIRAHLRRRPGAAWSAPRVAPCLACHGGAAGRVAAHRSSSTRPDSDSDSVIRKVVSRKLQAASRKIRLPWACACAWPVAVARVYWLLELFVIRRADRRACAVSMYCAVCHSGTYLDGYLALVAGYLDMRCSGCRCFVPRLLGGAVDGCSSWGTVVR